MTYAHITDGIAACPWSAFGRESPVATGWSRPKVVVECLEKPGRFRLCLVASGLNSRPARVEVG